MSVQKIPLETLQKIRQYIKNALTLPDSENHPKPWSSYDDLDDLPEPELLSDLGELFNFGGPLEGTTNIPNLRGLWFLSGVNPGSALNRLPGLRLKPDLRLVGYLNRTPNEGTGVIWALPEAYSTTAQLEDALAGCGDLSQPPHPAGAFEEVMEAVEGDRSPASFIVASLLRRELREFGALGKSVNWSHHRLVNAPPTQLTWQWRIEQPKDFSPKVRLFPDGRAAIEFFTCRVTPPIALFQHVDQYPMEHYKAAMLDRPIAIGKR